MAEMYAISEAIRKFTVIAALHALHYTPMLTWTVSGASITPRELLAKTSYTLTSPSGHIGAFHLAFTLKNADWLSRL